VEDLVEVVISLVEDIVEATEEAEVVVMPHIDWWSSQETLSTAALHQPLQALAEGRTNLEPICFARQGTCKIDTGSVDLGTLFLRTEIVFRHFMGNKG
jgi:hypothetical protein